MYNETTRVLIVGGSTIHGLGYEGRPFGQLIAEALGAEQTLDLTGVSRQCRQIASENAEQIRQFAPDVTIAMIGGTESLMRPNRTLQKVLERHAPAEWHGVAGLEPRARYSRSRWRRARQRASSAVRVAIKHVIFTVFRGGVPQVELPVLTAQLDWLLAILSTSSTRLVVVGLPPVSSLMFPGTHASFRRTNAVLEGLVGRSGTHACFVDLEPVLQRWSDYLADTLHLAASGHDRVAAAALDALSTVNPARERSRAEARVESH